MAKYKDWLKPEKLVLVEGWARDGLTNIEIAKNIGINVDTLYTWQKTHEEFANALKNGKEVSNYIVESSLLKCCTEGNVTAIIFWLCNRMPEKWHRNPDGQNDTVLAKLDQVIGGIDAIANE